MLFSPFQQAVDVICLCGTDGKLQPLRFRYKDENDFLRTAQVLEILDVKKIEHVGAERFCYLCKLQVVNDPTGADCHLMELVYMVRPHRWFLVKKLY